MTDSLGGLSPLTPTASMGQTLGFQPQPAQRPESGRPRLAPLLATHRSSVNVPGAVPSPVPTPQAKAPPPLGHYHVRVNGTSMHWNTPPLPASQDTGSGSRFTFGVRDEKAANGTPVKAPQSASTLSEASSAQSDDSVREKTPRPQHVASPSPDRKDFTNTGSREVKSAGAKAASPLLTVPPNIWITRKGQGQLSIDDQLTGRSRGSSGENSARTDPQERLNERNEHSQLAGAAVEYSRNSAAGFSTLSHHTSPDAPPKKKKEHTYCQDMSEGCEKALQECEWHAKECGCCCDCLCGIGRYLWALLGVVPKAIGIPLACANSICCGTVSCLTRAISCVGYTPAKISNCFKQCLCPPEVAEDLGPFSRATEACCEPVSQVSLGCRKVATSNLKLVCMGVTAIPGRVLFGLGKVISKVGSCVCALPCFNCCKKTQVTPHEKQHQNYKKSVKKARKQEITGATRSCEKWYYRLWFSCITGTCNCCKCCKSKKKPRPQRGDGIDTELNERIKDYWMDTRYSDLVGALVDAKGYTKVFEEANHKTGTKFNVPPSPRIDSKKQPVPPSKGQLDRAARHATLSVMHPSVQTKLSREGTPEVSGLKDKDARQGVSAVVIDIRPASAPPSSLSIPS